jgi:hypothetical protein
VNPPEGSIEVWGGEAQNGVPHAEQVRYLRGRDLLLSVRTVFADPEPAPVIRTVESFGTVLLNFRGHRSPERGRVRPDRERTLALWREEEQTPSRATTIVFDGRPIPGVRKDFADVSAAVFSVDGVHVFCVACAELLDRLRLRSPVEQAG